MSRWRRSGWPPATSVIFNVAEFVLAAFIFDLRCRARKVRLWKMLVGSARDFWKNSWLMRGIRKKLLFEAIKRIWFMASHRNGGKLKSIVGTMREASFEIPLHSLTRLTQPRRWRCHSVGDAYSVLMIMNIFLCKFPLVCCFRSQIG